MSEWVENPQQRFRTLEKHRNGAPEPFHSNVIRVRRCQRSSPLSPSNQHKHNIREMILLENTINKQKLVSLPTLTRHKRKLLNLNLQQFNTAQQQQTPSSKQVRSVNKRNPTCDTTQVQLEIIRRRQTQQPHNREQYNFALRNSKKYLRPIASVSNNIKLKAKLNNLDESLRGWNQNDSILEPSYQL